VTDSPTSGTTPDRGGPGPSSAPPVAEKRPIERTHHDDTFVDDYEWLRDKEGADTVAYL